MSFSRKDDFYKAAVFANLIVTTILAIGIYFGGLKTEVNNLKDSVASLSLEIKDVRNLVIQHMKETK